MTSLALIRHGKNDNEIGNRSRRDKGLSAVDDVIVTILDRCCLHCASIRTGPRLGEGKGALLLPPHLGEKVFFLLLLRAVTRQRNAEERIRSCNMQRGGHTHARQLLHYDRHHNITGVNAAIFARDRNAEIVIPCQLLIQLLRELSRLVDLRRKRRNLLEGKIPNGSTHELLHFCMDHDQYLSKYFCAIAAKQA